MHHVRNTLFSLKLFLTPLKRNIYGLVQLLMAEVSSHVLFLPKDRKMPFCFTAKLHVNLRVMLLPETPRWYPKGVPTIG